MGAQKKEFRLYAKKLFLSPVIFISGAAIWLSLSILSFLSSKVNKTLLSTFSNTISVGVYSIITFFILSFFFSGMIFLTKQVFQKKRAGFVEFFSGARKFTIRHFVLFTIVVIIGILIGRIAHYSAFFISTQLNLSIRPAQLLFLLIYFGALAFFLLFISFSSFYLVLYDLSLKNSVKSSVKFVKKNYLLAISIETILFVAFWFLNKLPSIFNEFIQYIVIIPLFVFIVSFFILSNENDLRAS